MQTLCTRAGTAAGVGIWASAAVASPMTTQYEVLDLGRNSGVIGTNPAINSSGRVALGYRPSQGTIPPPDSWDSGFYTTYSGVSSPLTGINDFGDLVTGSGRSPAGTVVYVNGQNYNLSTATGFTLPRATGINNTRQIILQDIASGPERAFLHDYTTHTTTPIGSFSTPGTGFTISTAINNNSQIVGYSRYSTTLRTRAFIWQAGSLAEIAPTSFVTSDTFAYDINDLGTAVGSVNSLQPAKFSNGSIQLLQTPSGSDACSAQTVTNDGFIAGFYRRTTGGFRAAYWDSQGNFHNLAELHITGENEWVFECVTDVNESGWIVGFGTHNGETRSFLLRPIPAPHSFAVFSLLLSRFVHRRRR